MTLSGDELRQVAAEVAPLAVDLRRSVHRHPELSYEEFRTTELIAETLEREGLRPRLRAERTGAIVDIGTSGTRVAFRADIDALPIEERTGLPFASAVPGVMHACGHDAHTAIGVGIAVALHRLGRTHGPLPGQARILFQPAEEAFPGGAHELVREGVVDDVGAIVAFHVDPTLEPGLVGTKAGPITSSSDRFEVVIEGPGGHTARPHETVDTIYAAGRVITELPALLERTVDARKPLSLVFGRIHGGNADNVIPTNVTLSGTCRLLHRDLWEQMPELIDRLVHQIVAPTGAKAVVHYQRGIPPVVNVPAVVAEVEFAVGAVAGTRAIAQAEPSMGAEDFSRYLEKVPGALIRLGARKGERTLDLHSASFDIDERAIEFGILVGTAALWRMMGCDWTDVR